MKTIFRFAALVTASIVLAGCASVNIDQTASRDDAVQRAMVNSSAVQTLFARHKAKASALGARLVEAERTLDSAFASKQIDAERVTALTEAIGVRQADLRSEHLQTHLTQTALLTTQQVALYQSLRGYDTSAIPAMTSPR